MPPFTCTVLQRDRTKRTIEVNCEEIGLCVAQTEHTEGRYTGFVAGIKQNYNVVLFRVDKWLTHVICYFLHIVDRDGKHPLPLPLTGCYFAQSVRLDRRVQMDENPLTVHNGNDFSFVNTPSPFAFDSHILAGLYFFHISGQEQHIPHPGCAAIVSATLERT
ncbi:hypothetical protein [Paraburkholderia phytofirmans]|uniref:hypothetical protein n=1 Tax=Paraburkholderia phytofirmans TaxID=261302 RepID=UPI0011E02B45|nr:hypothetical protein [Paraburkholderia phytofirmans]